MRFDLCLCEWICAFSGHLSHTKIWKCWRFGAKKWFSRTPLSHEFWSLRSLTLSEQKLVSQSKNANLPRAAVLCRREGWNDAVCFHLECSNRTHSLLHLIIIIYSQSKQATASRDFGLSDLKLGSSCTLFQAEIKRFGCWSSNLGSCWKGWTKDHSQLFFPTINNQNTMDFFFFFFGAHSLIATLNCMSINSLGNQFQS